MSDLDAQVGADGGVELVFTVEGESAALKMSPSAARWLATRLLNEAQRAKARTSDKACLCGTSVGHCPRHGTPMDGLPA